MDVKLVESATLVAIGYDDICEVLQLEFRSQTPPQSGWLDELGRLEGGRPIGLAVPSRQR